MKKISLSAILISLITVNLVFASDVSDAEYMSTIEIQNSGSALTNEIAVFDLSTSDMITSGMLNANATDCAVLTGTGGSDIAAMPSVNSTYPWCVWVDSIGAQSNLNQYLYSKGVTGGKTRYFPDTDGMIVAENASLELGDNSTIEINAYIDTSQNAHIANKPQAFSIWTYSGNTSAGIITDQKPTSYNDPSSAWADETKTYDYNNTTFAVDAAVPINTWSSYLELSSGTIWCDSVQVYADVDGISNEKIDIDAYIDGTWVDIYEDTFNDLASVNYNFNSTYLITNLRIRLYNEYDSGTLDARIHEVTFHRANPYVTKTVSSGEYKIEAYANTANLTLEIDDTVEDTIALGGASVNNTATDWIFFESAATPYVESLIISINGATIASWDPLWEYATTFTDSVSSIVATPTFRTSATNANLAASITSQEGLLTGTTPTANISGGWTMIGSTPSTPTNLFTEGDDSYGILGLNIGERITDAADSAGQDPVSWHILFVFGLAILIVIVIYGFTHNTRLGRNGSLLLSAIAAEAILIYFYKMETIPGLALIPFGVMALLLIVWRKSPAPVD